MAGVLGHRQTKEAATDNPNLRSPRHISTLPMRDTGLWSSGKKIPDATGDRRHCRETDVFIYYPFTDVVCCTADTEA